MDRVAPLPSGADLRREIAVRTPATRATAPNIAGHLGKAANGIARGVGGALSGLQAQLAKEEKDQDYLTRKMLADFRLETEADIEEYRKEMQPGAAGWREGWEERYKQSADRFVDGLGDDRRRDMVQAGITSHYQRLGGYAQKIAHKEYSRFTKEGLQNTLNNLVGRVDRAPDLLRETRTMGRKIIEASDLSPAQKSKLLSDYRQEAEKTHVMARLRDAKSPADYMAIRKDIDGNQEEIGDNELDAGLEQQPASDGGLHESYIERIKKFEGFAGKSSWDYKQESIGYGTKAKFKGEKISKEEADRRLREELGKARTIVDNAAPGAPEGVKAALQSLTFNAGSKWVKSGLGKAIAAGDYQKAKELFLQYNKAGGEVLPGLAKRRQQEATWFDEGSLPPTPSAEGYVGPYKNLDHKERDSLSRAVMQQYKRAQKALEKEVKETEGIAAQGKMLPEPMLEDLKARVAQGGSPAVQARLMSTLNLAQHISAMAKNNPVANEAHINQIHQQLGDRATPEQMERLGKLKAAVAQQKSMIDKDLITWSSRSGVVPETKLNMADAESMALRLEASETSANHFRVPIQYFTKLERERHAEALKSGDASIADYARTLAQHWGKAHARRALGEISGQAPEAALLGGHLVMSGNTAVAKDAEHGMKLLKTEGYKPFPAPIADVRVSMTNVFGNTIGHLPETQEGLRSLANAAYEARARKNGWADFKGDKYESILRELIGEREISGRKFGGIGESKAGYLWNTNPVLVPSNLRQDAFEDAMELIKVTDLPSAPVNPTTGRAMTQDDWESVNIISKGDGQYFLSFGADQAFDPTTLYRNQDGEAYVFKFADVEPMLKKKQPSWFVD